MNESKSAPKQYHILIGTSTPDGYCHAAYTVSLLKTFSAISKISNIQLSHKFVLNENQIARTRNQMAAHMLADPTITHLLFIDCDLQWEPKHVLKLLENNKPLTAGICPKRGYHWDRIDSNRLKDALDKDNMPLEKWVKIIKAHLLDYFVSFGPSRKVVNGVIEVEEVGAGFMLIAREVFERIAKTQPELQFKDPNAGLEINAANVLYRFFESEVRGTHYYPDDVVFCHRWSALGEKIFADLTLNLTCYALEPYEGNIMDVTTLQKRKSR